jgi:predicted metal-dependent HD superfamily phosphohydrolase
MNFEKAKQYVLRRLESELPPNLFYHALAHTRDDVAPAVERLAGMEDIQGESLGLLLTAAWFHDLGHVEQSANHEAIGARIAGEVLPGFGYTAEQIEIIKKAILATALPQSPATLLERILTDADLDVLGREDFMPRNEDLRRELASLGKTFTDLEWCVSQLKFLESHAYFTESAQKTRNEKKLTNIAELKRRITLLAQDK